MSEFMSITTGQRVTGRYCGGQFAGAVVSVRAHTVNSAARLVEVRVDGGTIKVNGRDEQRDTIMLTVGPDGREVDLICCADYLVAA